jgi:hypothetical protein
VKRSTKYFFQDIKVVSEEGGHSTGKLAKCRVCQTLELSVLRRVFQDLEKKDGDRVANATHCELFRGAHFAALMAKLHPQNLVSERSFCINAHVLNHSKRRGVPVKSPRHRQNAKTL